MPQVIRERTRVVRGSDPQRAGRIRAVPILGESHEQPPYALLTPENVGKIVVTEVDTSGSVPELSVHNGLDIAVFLMDSQELIGAKQNRILNTDVMVAPRTTLKIPVNCVEQGRWGYNSRQFSPGKSAAYRTRRRKSATVHESLKMHAVHHSDQSATWTEVRHCLCESSAQSPSAALSDAYQAREADLARERAALRLPPTAVGLAMFRDDRFLGLDVFDRHSTLAHFWGSLVDSYLIESLARPYDPQQQQEHEAAGHADDGLSGKVAEVLEKASRGNWEDFDSPGLGRDHRLEHDVLAGSGLVIDDQVLVHLQLFPNAAPSDPTIDRQRRSTSPRAPDRTPRQGIDDTEGWV